MLRSETARHWTRPNSSANVRAFPRCASIKAGTCGLHRATVRLTNHDASQQCRPVMALRAHITAGAIRESSYYFAQLRSRPLTDDR